MTPDLRRRIGFTVGALLVYRIGAHIPLPGIEPAILAQLFRSPPGAGLASSGVGVHHLAIFALGLTPYLSAAIFLQLATIVSRRLRSWRDRGERGRRAILRYTLCLTGLLALFQSYGVATGLERVPGVISDPGWLFRLTTVLTLTCGCFFLVWLSEQITARGVGNGLALLLMLEIILQFPNAVAGMFQLATQGLLSGGALLGLVALTVAFVGWVVFMELARRRIPVTFAAREGPQETEARSSAPSFLNVKLNSAGAVIPPILTSWIMLLTIAIAFMAGVPGGVWWEPGATSFDHARLLHAAVQALALFVCTIFYAAFVLDPDGIADGLAKQGGSVSGLALGESAAAHLDRAFTRMAILGALYLTVVYLVPEALAAAPVVPFYLGGPSLLLVVCAIMDLDSQVRGARQRFQ